MDIFNGANSGSVLYFTRFNGYPRNTAALTGSLIGIDVIRTTGSGTPGVTLLCGSMSTSNPLLGGSVTARVDPTALTGSTGQPLVGFNLFTEEGANTTVGTLAYDNPGGNVTQKIVCRAGEGLVFRQSGFPAGYVGSIVIQAEFYTR
jgi:hypothetical protein